MDNLLGKSWELFVFDWDGTVMDTTYLIARGMQEASKALGYPEPPLALARSTIGLGEEDTMRIICPDCPRSRFAEFGNAYRKWYIPREGQVPVFEGLDAMLWGMHRAGLRLAIATGKSWGGMQRVFGITGMAPIFEAVKTADRSWPKPNPAMLLELADETGVEPGRMVMVGDAIHDMQMAANAGASAVGVTYGGGDPAQLEPARPHAVVPSVAELARVLGVVPELNAELARRGKSPISA